MKRFDFNHFSIHYHQVINQDNQGNSDSHLKNSLGTINPQNFPFIDHIHNLDTHSIFKLSKQFENFDKVYVLGTGGSSLGAQALCELYSHLKKVFFLTHTDPDVFNQTLSEIDYLNAGFLIISKSGETIEVVIQTILLLQKAKQVLSLTQLKKHFLLITQHKESTLSQIAQDHNILTHLHPPLGGRYSVLSVVGLLPALLQGVDIVQVIESAKSCFTQFKSNDPTLIKTLQAGVFFYAKQAPHLNNHVLLSYWSKLKSFTYWHRQLFAESLGKRGRGLNPIIGIGPEDQHSQLQLWLDGPQDKIFTVLAPHQTSYQKPQANQLTDPITPYHYLNHQSSESLQYASAFSTIKCLKSAHPTRVFELLKLDESTLGSLLAYFMLEVIWCAQILGVNPFDQPAVESGKKLTRSILKEIADITDASA